MEPDYQAGGVLRFWFEELEPKQWWKKDPEIDDLIRSRYGKLQRRAAAVELHSWRNSAKGRLAEIILLDQFPRNIFRNTPLAYASDPLALGLAQEAISAKADESLEPQEQTFLYMPFMHSESIEINQESVDKINWSKNEGGRVICVGTTTLRCLESVAKENNGELKPFSGETNIFIYPGFKFSVVDALITNFHLPKSTLLLLVSAFGGYEKIRSAYEYAIRKKYRFYSYGDSMFIDLNLK